MILRRAEGDGEQHDVRLRGRLGEEMEGHPGGVVVLFPGVDGIDGDAGHCDLEQSNV